METIVNINIYWQLQKEECVGKMMDSILESLDMSNKDVALSAETIGWGNVEVCDDDVGCMDGDDIEWGWNPSEEIEGGEEEQQKQEKTELEKALDDIDIARQMINGEISPEFALVYHNLLTDIINRVANRLKKVVQGIAAQEYE